jgi:hypothetical protein
MRDAARTYRRDWQRVERSRGLGRPIPAVIQRRVEAAWEQLTEIGRTTMLGGFVAYAKCAVLAIVEESERVKGGGRVAPPGATAGESPAVPAPAGTGRGPVDLDGLDDEGLRAIEAGARERLRTRSIERRRGERLAAALGPRLGEVERRLLAEQAALNEAQDVVSERLGIVRELARQIAAHGRVELEAFPAWIRTVGVRRKAGGTAAVVDGAKGGAGARRWPWTAEQRQAQRLKLIAVNAARYGWSEERLAEALAAAGGTAAAD